MRINLPNARAKETPLQIFEPDPQSARWANSGLDRLGVMQRAIVVDQDQPPSPMRGRALGVPHGVLSPAVPARFTPPRWSITSRRLGTNGLNSGGNVTTCRATERLPSTVDGSEPSPVA